MPGLVADLAQKGLSWPGTTCKGSTKARPWVGLGGVDHLDGAGCWALVQAIEARAFTEPATSALMPQLVVGWRPVAATFETGGDGGGRS